MCWLFLKKSVLLEKIKFIFLNFFMILINWYKKYFNMFQVKKYFLKTLYTTISNTLNSQFIICPTSVQVLVQYSCMYMLLIFIFIVFKHAEYYKYIYICLRTTNCQLFYFRGPSINSTWFNNCLLATKILVRCWIHKPIHFVAVKIMHICLHSPVQSFNI